MSKFGEISVPQIEIRGNCLLLCIFCNSGVISRKHIIAIWEVLKLWIFCALFILVNYVNKNRFFLFLWVMSPYCYGIVDSGLSCWLAWCQNLDFFSLQNDSSFLKSALQFFRPSVVDRCIIILNKCVWWNKFVTSTKGRMENDDRIAVTS